MTSELLARRMLVVLVVVSAAMLLVVLKPFGTPLLLAAALAGALSGVEERLARRLHGRRKLAAGVLVAGVLFALLLPLGGLVTFTIREAIQFGHFIADTVQSGGTEALVHKLPHWLQGSARGGLERLREGVQRSEGLLSSVGGQGAQAALWLGGAVAATTVVIVKTVLLLIALFALLVDGRRLVAWIEDVSPLAPGQARALLQEFRRVVSAVLRSTILTALVQSTIALVGFLIARAPAPVFLALLSFMFALIPLAGAALVTVFTAVALILSGHLLAGIFLCAWGVLVVGLVDNVVKPILIKGGMEVHGVLIFFVLLGGLATFGPVGLVVGPIALSFFLAAVRLTRRPAEARVPVPPAPPRMPPRPGLVPPPETLRH